MNGITIRQALVGVTAASLFVGLLSAGIALDHRLETELERKAMEDLAMAPKVLEDRMATEADALMMRAKELAGEADLAGAVAGGRAADAVARADGAGFATGEAPLLVGPDGRSWSETVPADSLVDATRRGEMPVGFQLTEGRLHRVALAPVMQDGQWRGAAGVARLVDETTAGVLSGLTRTEVVIVGPDARPLAATDTTVAPIVSDSALGWNGDGRVRRLAGTGSAGYWAVSAPLGDAGSVVFLRDVESELGVLPGLRRAAAISALLALTLTLGLVVFLAGRLARPVQELADAARQLAAGRFEAPVADSQIRELEDVAEAFRDMRAALAEKIAELTRANDELEDRQRRLQALQAEVLQRDRLAASGRLITELAHEIRNPVAGVRNCLELIDRRLDPDSELRELAAMGIDELLRMHRLAEKMLDANRPLDPEADRCDPVEVARLVADLAAVGEGPGVRVELDGSEADGANHREAGHGGAGDLSSGAEIPDAAVGPDTMKQILLNLVENAREATERVNGAGGPDVVVRIGRAGGTVSLEVLDRGPGMGDEVRGRVFDPFFTTKDAVHGVGLGLFVAEGLARRHGGRLLAFDREDGGARFRVELPEARIEAEA